jgi:hypothetical protein
MYIIQTNTNFVNDKLGDFQSLMYGIDKLTWDEFKEYILSSETINVNLLRGTMKGSIKATNWKVEEILINDDIHLEIIAVYGKYNFRVNVKYYMVTNEAFKGLR